MKINKVSIILVVLVNLLIFNKCYVHVVNVGYVERDVLENEGISLKITFQDDRCRDLEKSQAYQSIALKELKKYCEYGNYFLKIEEINKRLNDKFFSHSAKRNIDVNISYRLRDKSVEESFVYNANKNYESKLDFIARGISGWTMGIIPGWSITDDFFYYQFLDGDKVLYEFSDSNSGTFIVSIIYLPYFFFRSISDSIFLRVDYMIRYHMDIFLRYVDGGPTQIK